MGNDKAAILSGISCTVGDPVDVVRGANIDWNRDFLLDGPLPLDWIRYYDSSKLDRLCALGWGHTHEYDRRLEFDADGLRYVLPVGQAIGFPPLETDGAQISHQGVTLRRIHARAYEIHEGDKRAMEFSFPAGRAWASLIRVSCGRHQISFAYSPEGWLQEIIDSLGNTIQVSTDTAGRLLHLVLRRSPSAREHYLYTCQYDEAGNLVQCVDPYRNSSVFRFDDSNRMIAHTDRRGYTFHYIYDNEGRCISSSGEDGLHRVRLDYRPRENTTVVTKHDGGKWTYTYNERGAVVLVVDPYGGTQSSKADARHDVVEQCDSSGGITQFVYSDTGALLGTKDELGRFRTTDSPKPYDPLHRQYTPRTPLEWELGGRWAFSYFRPPPPNSPVLAQLPAGLAALVQTMPVVTREKTARASVGSHVPLGPPQAPGRCEYDLFGNLMRYADPAGAVHRWIYDANGNVSERIDPEGSVWKSTYASWNLLSQSNDPFGNTTEYSYTASEKPESVVDPGGTRTVFTYDLKDRLTSVARHGVIKETIHYGRGGRLVELRDSAGQRLSLTEYGAGDLPQSVRSDTGIVATFVYDARGRLIGAENAAGTVTREFDGLGNLLCDRRNGLGVVHSYRGFKPSQTEVLAQFTTSYAAATDGDVVITDPTGHVHRFRHLGDGVFLRLLGNGTTEVSQYDWAGRCRLKASYASTPETNLLFRQYFYSPCGNLVRIRDLSTGTVEYHYDKSHRLQGASRPGVELQRYAYDTAGNLVEAPGLDAAVINENRLVAANGDRIIYNHRNHIAKWGDSDRAAILAYDAADMLVHWRAPAGELSVQYDALGRRTSKTYNGRETVFYWDRDRLIAEVSPEGLRVYVYYDLDAVVPFMCVDYDSVDADAQSGTPHYIFVDQVGCPIRMENQLRETVWEAAVAPYGRTTVSSSSSAELHLRFPGHYFDQETGLHYNRCRYYSPELGRYVQADPIDIEGGENVYAYTRCPLVEVDLDGRGCPPRPLIHAADDPAFQKARDEAVALAARLREAMETTPVGVRKDGTPVMAHEQMTLAVLVVRRTDGTYDTVIASSTSPTQVPWGVVGAAPEGIPWVNAPRRDRGTVASEGDTGHHAEQRGMRWADCEPGVEGVASITPTRPCCPGCTQAIQGREGAGMDTVNPIPGLPRSRQ